MNNLMLSTYAWIEAQLYHMGQRVEDEGGLETVEYIALIGVVLVLLGAVGTAFKDNGERVGQEAVNVLVEFLNKLKG
jgi:hypothetical protein